MKKSDAGVPVARTRKGRLAPLASLATASLVVSGAVGIGTAANADEVETEADSAAHAHLLWVDGVGLDVAGAGRATTEFSPPGPNESDNAALNLELLDAVQLGLNGLDLPLIKPAGEEGPGLLDLGALGAAESYASSPTANNAFAATGLLTEEGALNTDAYQGGVGDPAQLDLSALVRQIIGDAVADELLTGASITIGAVGSQIEKDGPEITSTYRLADLQADLTSPALGDATAVTDDIVGGALAPVEGLLAPGDAETEPGAIFQLVSALVTTLDAVSIPIVGGVDASLNGLGLDTATLTESVRNGLLEEPIDNSTADAPASVSVDLSDGTITVDLAQVLLESDAAYAGLDLNSLPANTDVLTGDVVNAITAGVTSAVTGTGPNSLTTKAVDLITEGIYGVAVDLDIDLGVGLLGLPVTDASVTLQSTDGTAATLGGLLGVDGYLPAELEIDDPGLLGGLLGTVTDILNPVVGQLGDLLSPAVDGVLANLQPTVNGVLDPIVANLLNVALQPVLTQVAALTINEQPEVGDLGDGSFTVRALSVELLPLLGEGSVDVELGSSTVRALDQSVVGTDPAYAGLDLPISGDGWPAGSTVTVTLEDEEGNVMAG
ncbi:choice-of-anchor G family protein, partial [Microbacterium oryzae]|uniref:choice-of-anchor G family protein n=1 Tax=Microbacterium oryzae TaxID=743009 RepID=UPI0025B1E76B